MTNVPKEEQEELGTGGCSIPQYKPSELHDAPRAYAKLCALVGANVRDMDFMECFMLAGKIERDEFLRNRWLAGNKSFEEVIHQLSPAELQALRSRILA